METLHDVRDDEGPLAAKGVANVKGCESAEEAAGLEDRDNVALEVLEVAAPPIKTEGFLERIHCQDTTDQTSIPPEKLNSVRTQHCTDCFERAPTMPPKDATTVSK